MLVCSLLEREEDFRVDRPSCGCRVPLRRDQPLLRSQTKKNKQATEFPFFMTAVLFIDLVHGGV